MAELFIELLGEEIPARMQEAAEKRFANAVMEGLVGAGLAGGDAPVRSWSGPRRLAVSVDGVAAKQPDVSEEKRGPRADAPKQAIDGFLKSTGIRRNELETRSTPKGDFLFAVVDRKGRLAREVLPGVIDGILSDFTWPKTMRWNRSDRSWIRPLHRITAVLGGKALGGSFDLGGGMEILFGRQTEGHRMLAPKPFPVAGAEDYVAGLGERFVIAGRSERKEAIARQLEGLARKQRIALKEDPGLLEEVTGLVECPNAVLGSIDNAFMDLPKEILVTAMRSHQKYFAFEDDKGGLAPVFATVANMAPDKQRDAAIRAGNERVLRARLADAHFFWEQDKAIFGLEPGEIENPKANRNDRLAAIQFFDDLGTMADKAERIAALSSAIAGHFENPGNESDGRDAKAIAESAGRLAKFDLATQTVREFPDLQGVIGGHLIGVDGENSDIAAAVSSHYRPEGPSDAIPGTSLGRILALADKVDTLVGFFAIGQAPTGSRDPYALRRAALGVIRIVIESGTPLTLAPVIEEAARRHGFQEAPDALMAFLHDRLRVWLRDRGIRHDIVAAVVRPGAARADDLLHLFRLAEAMAGLLETGDGKGLLAGYTRTSSILADEEKKDGLSYGGLVDKNRLKAKEAIALFKAVEGFSDSPVGSTDEAIERLLALGKLRTPIDAFFESVVVNDEDPVVRRNRLNLLGRVRAVMEEIADFSAIEG